MDTVPSSKNISSTLVPLFADVSVNSILCLFAYPWPFYEQKWKNLNVWTYHFSPTRGPQVLTVTWIPYPLDWHIRETHISILSFKPLDFFECYPAFIIWCFKNIHLWKCKGLIIRDMQAFNGQPFIIFIFHLQCT